MVRTLGALLLSLPHPPYRSLLAPAAERRSFSANFGAWQSSGPSNLPGSIAWFAGLLLWVTSIHWVRRRLFEVGGRAHERAGGGTVEPSGHEACLLGMRPPEAPPLTAAP